MSFSLNNIRKKVRSHALAVLYKKAELQNQLININLSLSNVCGARCIFCPKIRGMDDQIKVMPIDYAKKIADEIAGKKSKTTRNVRKMNVGENGDALLNPEFINILRYIKLKNPNVKISLFCNFQNLTKEISEIILKEKLVNFIGVNIDGHDSDSYFRVKKIPLDVVMKNLMDFLQVRNKIGSIVTMQVFVLTYASYVKTIYKKIGKLPMYIDQQCNIENLEDDFPIITRKLESLLNPKIDLITRSGIYLWAERENINLTKPGDKSFNCPIINRVMNECFIAPNGDWYACCWDELQNIVFGNVIEKSIDEVYHSDSRIKFLNLLRQQKFDQLPYPCNKVESCQPLVGEL